MLIFYYFKSLITAVKIQNYSNTQTKKQRKEKLKSKDALLIWHPKNFFMLRKHQLFIFILQNQLNTH